MPLYCFTLEVQSENKRASCDSLLEGNCKRSGRQNRARAACQEVAVRKACRQPVNLTTRNKQLHGRDWFELCRQTAQASLEESAMDAER